MKNEVFWDIKTQLISQEILLFRYRDEPVNAV
jgi:hypothetical protein